MLPFDEALARVLALAGPPAHEEVTLEAALGRVLAEDVAARSPLPPFTHSAMDGYAVAAADLAGSPATQLPVRGESRTGRAAPPLPRGTTCRIFTGAPLPAGADAVVLQEDVELHADAVRFGAPPRPGDNVRRAGEDLAAGAIAVPRGTRVTSLTLGLLAATDTASVLVARRPRVAILATGDELRAPGSAGGPATIPESNGLVLAALAAGAGAEVRRLPRVADDLDEAACRIDELLDASDLLLTIGGVSVGDHDVVRAALERAGAALEFHRVAIKPGKPLAVGRRGRALVLGLPGNPMSAQITFLLFGLPLLDRMQGGPGRGLRRLRAPLAAAVPHRPGRRGFYAATLGPGGLLPLAGRASGSTVSLAQAEALIVAPESGGALAAGDVVDALLLAGEL